MSNLPSELVHTLTGHEGPVLNVRFNPKGTYCISCGKVRWQQQQAIRCCHSRAVSNIEQDSKASRTGPVNA